MQEGWPRTARDCAPREETASPVPGTTGVSQLVSDGVEQSPFPSPSITQTIDVSGGGPSDPPHAGRRLAGINHLAPLRRVSRAGERIERDVYEVRVAEIGFPVGEGELQGLRHRMEVGVRALLQRPDARRFGDGERFEQERPLAPRAAGVNLDRLAIEAEAAGDRRHDLAAKALKVRRREQPVVLPLVREDLVRDVAPVERAPHRREAGHAVVARRALLVAEELQCAAEIGLHQPLARRRHRAARHPDRDVLRPVAVLVGVAPHVVEHDRMAREALARIAHRARRPVAKAHGAPALQRLDAGIGRGRHHGAPHPQRNLAAVALDVGVRVERLRPAADACDGDDLAGLGEADDHGCDAGDAHLVAVDHAEGEDRGDACVDGVAAVLERLERGQRRELVARADHVVMTAGDGNDGHGNLRLRWAGSSWRCRV